MLFLVLFGIYVRSIHPAYRLDDSPLTAACALHLSVQPAPGYPLHTLLGRVWVALPVGGPYIRVNLLSAASLAGACALVPSLVMRVMPGGYGLAGGLIAGFALGVSRLAWDQALSAKGGIYALNVLLLFAALGARRNAGWLAAGLALANHWMTVVCWLPGLIASGRPWTRRKAALGLVLLATGSTAYLQFPLSAVREPSYGDAGTLSGFTGVVLRRDLGGAASGKSVRDTAGQFLWSLLMPLREAQLPFTAIALAGGVVLWRRNRRLFVALGSGWALTLLAVVAVANPVHRRTGEWIPWFTAPFLLPCLAALAPALGAALGAGLASKRPLFPLRRAALLLFFLWGVAAAVPLSLWHRHAPKADHSMDYAGFDFAENLRASVPGAAGWFAELEFNGLPMLASHWIEGRIGRVIVTNPYLERRWGWRRLRAGDPALVPDLPEHAVLDRDEAGRAIGGVAGRLMAGGAPVAFTPTCSYPAVKARLVPVGIAQRSMAPGGVRDPGLRRLRMRGLLGDRPHRDELTSGVLDAYVDAASRPADNHRRAGRMPETIAGYRRAVRYPGRVVKAATLRDLGIALGMSGDHPGAEAAFREAAKLRKRDWMVWKNLAVALEKQGRNTEAEAIRARIPADVVIR